MTVSRSRYIPANVREYTLNRDGFACRYCGTTQEQIESWPQWLPKMMRTMHVDHVWPHRLGGSNQWWNLVAACPDCNLAKQHRFYREDLIHENLRQIDVLGVLLGTVVYR